MSKLLEDMRNETAGNAAIASAVETARHYGIGDDVILVDIMTRFDLKENEAKNYMIVERE